jgi:2-hydroxy-6-oxonona-2,4-dienedioate hydrolase
MTKAIHWRWPLYALLGAGAALALHHAGSRHYRGRQLQRGQIRELQSVLSTVNGQQMHARVATGAAGLATLPVVMIHGLGVSGSYFIPVAQRLAAEFDVYVPDLPGHGLSATPEVQPDIPGLAQALIDWMDCTGITRACLVGHSMGCQVAVELTLRHPGRIGRLVLIAPVPDPAAPSILQQLGRFAMGSIFERPSLVPQVIKDYLRMGGRFIPEFHDMLAYPIEAKLPDIAAPVMLIRGEHDALAPQTWLDAAARLLRATPPVVIARWGHAVHYSGAAEVAESIRPFLGAGLPGQKCTQP